MRIIRVKSCCDCPYTEIDDDFCIHLDAPDNLNNILSHIQNKTIPKECPLEDVQGIIKNLGVPK
jgi:hypothetical protein